jgi:uncharacterized membrane protein YqaE (UPF0057 family)
MVGVAEILTGLLTFFNPFASIIVPECCVCLREPEIFTVAKNLILLIFGYIAGSFFKKMQLLVAAIPVAWGTDSR